MTLQYYCIRLIFGFTLISYCYFKYYKYKRNRLLQQLANDLYTQIHDRLQQERPLFSQSQANTGHGQLGQGDIARHFMDMVKDVTVAGKFKKHFRFDEATFEK